MFIIRMLGATAVYLITFIFAANNTLSETGIPFKSLSSTPPINTIILDLEFIFPTSYRFHESLLKEQLLEKILEKIAPTVDVQISRSYVAKEAAWHTKWQGSNSRSLSEVWQLVLEMGRFDRNKIDTNLGCLDWGKYSESGKTKRFTWEQRNVDLAAILKWQNVSVEHPDYDATLPRIRVAVTAVRNTGYMCSDPSMVTIAEGFDAQIEIQKEGKVVHAEKLECEWPGSRVGWVE